MADVQLEHGYLRVAFSLSAALARMGFSGLEHDIILSVMNLSYGRNLKEAQISIDDLRALLGKRSGTRATLVEQGLQSLIDKSVITCRKPNQHVMFLGIQKDFEKWSAPTEKFASSADTINNDVNTVNAIVGAKNAKNQIDALLPYLKSLCGYEPPSQLMKSMDIAGLKTMYAAALQKTRDPNLAYWYVRDYIDYTFEDNDWLRRNVTKPIQYMVPRMSHWLSNIPAEKDFESAQWERLTNKRMRFNLKRNDWEVADDK